MRAGIYLFENYVQKIALINGRALKYSELNVMEIKLLLFDKRETKVWKLVVNLILFTTAQCYMYFTDQSLSKFWNR